MCAILIILKNITSNVRDGCVQLGWGANDGIISVTSLVVGIAASGASTHTLLVTCIAGLISGAASMAAGEYISVKSQQDIEKNDLEMEQREL